MCCSKKIAIPVTEETRELINYLWRGPTVEPEDVGRYFTFTISLDGHVANRSMKSPKGLDKWFDNRCKDNSITFLNIQDQSP